MGSSVNQTGIRCDRIRIVVTVAGRHRYVQWVGAERQDIVSLWISSSLDGRRGARSGSGTKDRGTNQGSRDLCSTGRLGSDKRCYGRHPSQLDQGLASPGVYRTACPRVVRGATSPEVLSIDVLEIISSCMVLYYVAVWIRPVRVWSLPVATRAQKYPSQVGSRVKLRDINVILQPLSVSQPGHLGHGLKPTQAILPAPVEPDRSQAFPRAGALSIAVPKCSPGPNCPLASVQLAPRHHNQVVRLAQ